MMRLAWATAAIRDREEIMDFIAADNPTAALYLDEVFVEKSALLIDHPFLGRAGIENGTRELIVQSHYKLIYVVHADTVEILRVIHTARRWPPAYQDTRDEPQP